MKHRLAVRTYVQQFFARNEKYSFEVLVTSHGHHYLIWFNPNQVSTPLFKITSPSQFSNTPTFLAARLISGMTHAKASDSMKQIIKQYHETLKSRGT